MGSTPKSADPAFDDAACGLLLTEVDGRILRANRTFCGWVACAESDLVGGTRFQELLTMGGRIFHQTHWAPLLEMQGSISEVKLEIKRGGGPPIPIVTNAVRRQEGDRVVHHLAIFVARDRDTYERELVESQRRLRELVQETKELHEAAADRAHFAQQMMGIVSHDLRNPLSTIQMGTEVLAGAGLAHAHEQVLARIVRASHRADRLIRDLLDFTQASLGTGLAVSPSPIDLHVLIAESVDELALAFPGRALVHTQEGPAKCTADGDRVAQLVGNLVGNAMAYGDPSSPVTVHSAVNETTLSISVHNRGAPIPEERRADLFSPMTRGAESASSASRSVGLGLYIVQEIARSHGGGVTVESTAEVGTTFTVSLPIAPEPSGARSA